MSIVQYEVDEKLYCSLINTKSADAGIASALDEKQVAYFKTLVRQQFSHSAAAMCSLALCTSKQLESNHMRYEPPCPNFQVDAIARGGGFVTVTSARNARGASLSAQVADETLFLLNEQVRMTDLLL